MHVPFINLKAQYSTIAEEIDQGISRVLGSTDFVLGPDVALFEEEFAAYCNVAHCVALDSGTSALELALRACEVGPSDEVITAANTFIATVSAIALTGARPVLVDVDSQTCNLDIEATARAITPRTKAIIPVHLYGQPADMESVLHLAECMNLTVIEDACQAHGAFYGKRRAGSLGDVACFSFYPSKNLGAYGDGGALVTNNATIAEKVRMLRNYGQTQKYHHRVLGYNHRLDTLQAAILRAKLPHLDSWNEQRAQRAYLYNRLLADVPVITPYVSDGVTHVYHLYVVRVQNRAMLQAYLAEQGISTGIHYPIPIHLQEACEWLGYEKGDFPIAERCANQVLSLPMYPELTQEQVAYVAEAIRVCLQMTH